MGEDHDVESRPVRGRWTTVRLVVAALVVAAASAVLAGCGGLLAAPSGERHQSADGRRTAVVQGGRLIVDGIPYGPSFVAIAMDSVRFSPNGDRLAYLGTRGSRIFVAVDGREYGAFAGVSTDGVRFSPRGEHVTALVSRSGKWYVWMGDREFGPYEDLAAGHPFFSEDDRHFGYAAYDGSTWALWLDGKRSTRLGRSFVPGSLGFMAEGRPYFAYLSPEGWRFQIGSLPGEAFQDFNKPVTMLSPDRKSLAYIGRRGMDVHVCVDQRCGPPHRRVGQWSPEGQVSTDVPWRSMSGWQERMGFSAYAASLSRLSVGRVHSAITDAVDRPHARVGSVVFSPDSRHHAYLASDETDAVVIDGETVVALPPGRPLEWMRFDDSSQVLMYRLAGQSVINVVAVPGAVKPPASQGAPAAATLRVTASQPDVLVFVDGRYEGMAPLDVPVVPGTRRIDVRGPGWGTRSIDIEAVAGDVRNVDGSPVRDPVRSAIATTVARADASNELAPASDVSATELMRARLLTGIPMSEEVLGVFRSTSPGRQLVLGETGLYGFDVSALVSSSRRGTFVVPYEELVRLPAPSYHPLFEIALTPDVAIPVAYFRISMSRLVAFRDELRAALKTALPVAHSLEAPPRAAN